MELTRWSGQVLGLAFCYFLAGQVGLLQAIQPGYATAIWPASGIAVAGILLFGFRVWPGIFIGSFSVNVLTTFDAETAATVWLSLAVPFGIGCGAALQAVLGAVMVRRLLGFPNPLNLEKDVATLIVFIIPASCLIGATIGVSVLWSADRFRLEECAFNWWTWYLGDVIGVLVVAPLVMLWTAPQPDWPRRPISVTVPVSILALLVVFVFIYTNYRERERLQTSFELHTNTLKRSLESTLEQSIEALTSMKRFHGKSPNQADRNRFTRIAGTILTRRRDTVHGLAWLPRVRSAEREQFEEAGRILYKPDFCIKERDEFKSFVKAAERLEYYPLLYRSPDPDEPGAWGFDIASQSERAEVLLRAAVTAEPIASSPLPPLQNAAGEKLILVYLATYKDGVAPEAAADRQDELLGYMVAILRVDQLAKSAWERIDTQGIDITLLAEGEGAAKDQAVYHLASPDLTPTQRGRGEERRTTFQAAGRTWTLEFVPTRQYQTAHRSMQAWSVLTLGTLATGLLGGILLVITGRTALITKLVENRTIELEQANATLVQQIEERQRVEESLRLSEERFRLLVDGTVDFAIFMLDPAGHVVSWNNGAERIQGYKAAEIVGKHFSCFYTSDDAQIGKPDNALRVAETTGRHEDEGWRVRKDGTKLWANGILTALRGAEGELKGFSKITRDLTERQRVEAALVESRHLVDRIAEMIPSILYVYDLHQHCYVFVNNRIQSILGYDPQDVKQPRSALLADNYHPDDLPTMEWVHEQYQTAEDDAVIETEYRMRHANGDWRWLHTYNTIFMRESNGEPSQILGTAQDITERKRLEQEVLDIAAQEQRRIGLELHDGTGQELTGLSMLADNLGDTLREDGRAEEQFARRIAQGLRDALAHVRGLTRGLVPVEVDAEGLMSSLNDLAARISSLNSVRCVFECAEPVPMEDNNTATQLYRIAQEAITNALRHGHAANICVTLESRGYYVTLRIMDDGVGVPPLETVSEGMGLRIMRYRAGQIGAQLSVRRGPTRGTVVLCTVFRGIFHA